MESQSQEEAKKARLAAERLSEGGVEVAPTPADSGILTYPNHTRTIATAVFRCVQEEAKEEGSQALRHRNPTQWPATSRRRSPTACSPVSTAPFRFINEQLYTKHSKEAVEMFQQDRRPSSSTTAATTPR